MELIPEVVAAVAPTPVLAAGGIGYLLGEQAGQATGEAAGYRTAVDQNAAASWANTPAGQAAFALDRAASVDRLTRCDGQGWKVVAYGPDTSRNKNLSLTADNDGKKYSVKIAHFAKDATPNLNLMVVSGCYQVPDGETVDRF